MTTLLFLLTILAAVVSVQLLRGVFVRGRASRLMADTVGSDKEPLLMGEPQQSWLTTWLAPAGYRSPSAAPVFLAATAGLTALALGAIFLITRFGVMDGMVETVSAILGGLGDVLAAVLKGAPYIILVIFAAAPALIVRAARLARIEAIEQDLAPMLLDEAETQLAISGKLGAPIWRIAYGAGLIDEARGRFADAGSRYQEALRAKPGWRQAESRLRALVAAGKIPSIENFK